MPKAKAAKRAPRKAPAKAKELKPTDTGLAKVDALSVKVTPTVEEYIQAVSEYILEASTLARGRPKQAQIALSAGLGRALAGALVAKVSRIKPHAGELNVAGALRVARADVSEAHPLDGLRLAVEIKPVNLAVGRALWNRFGDVRAFAVNIHLKFPFAVVGGVLAVPTWEWAKVSKTMAAAAESESEQVDAVDAEALALPAEENNDEDVDEDHEAGDLASAAAEGEGALHKKPTDALIDRLVRRLRRTRLRETEADAAHLLEAIAVLVYNPDTGRIDAEMPPKGSGLRWEEFVETMAELYDVRFED